MKTDNQKKKIIKIIIIIIVVLLLITSCASSYFGTIGNMFKSISSYFITGTEKDKNIILNQNLKFETLDGEANLSDEVYLIGYETDKINHEGITCITSDASIATCVNYYDYVKVLLKSSGNVEIILEKEQNGNKYKAIHNLKINKEDEVLSLSKYRANIYLDESNILKFVYYLKNAQGDVTFTQNNDNVKVSIKNGKVTVEALKAGLTKITLSVKDQEGKTVNKTFVVNVMNTRPSTKTTTSTTTKTTTTKKGKSTNNYLSSITINKGTLSPSFNKNTNKYNVVLPYEDNKISINIKKESDKANITYTLNNKAISNISNINLNVGENILKVKVTAENGNVNTYEIIITRQVDQNLTLSSLSITNTNINELFNSNTFNYDIKTNFKNETFKINAFAKNSNANITVIYDNENHIYNSNDSYTLNIGDNNLKIKVSLDNKEAIYNINIHRALNKYMFDKANYEFNIAEGPFYLTYYLLIDGVESLNYNPNELTCKSTNYQGTCIIDKGIITLVPTKNDINKNIKISIKSSIDGDLGETNVEFKKDDYYLNINSSSYNVDYINGSGFRNIVYTTNILGNTVNHNKESNILNIISNVSKNSIDSESKIKVYTSNPSVATVEYEDKGVLKIVAHSLGDTIITIESSIFGENLTTKTFNVHVIGKYNVEINANGGFFNSFTDKYIYTLSQNTIIDLNEYVPYKVDTTGNCLLYSIDHYNTLADNTGTSYNKDDLVTVNKNITLYAIYSSTSQLKPMYDTKKLYLTDVDLFLNQEYYDKYGVKKMIYPGANGYHVMEITNNAADTLTINKINLEEDTVCVNDGCINMGYVIKYNNGSSTKYYLGGANSYDVINKSSTITDGIKTGYKHTTKVIDLGEDKIVVHKGETIEIPLIWKWVDSDSLDTEIGKKVNSIDTINGHDNYQLTVSIEYELGTQYCDLN